MTSLLAINFLFPAFLTGLIALAIPVIVHLFNFRKFKKIPFTNVRFLKEIKEETNNSKRLKHLLVLASRMLALAAMVLAFAQPFIPLSRAVTKNATRAISVFVDNSFSMELAGKEGTLLQQATSRARDIAMAYRPSDKFQLLTNDFAAPQQRLLTREEFIEALPNIKSTTFSRSLHDIYLRQQEALTVASGSDKLSFIISDCQQSAFDFQNLQPDSSIQTRILPLPANAAKNVYIDTAWLANPLVQLNQPTALHVVLRNAGNDDITNVPVKLFINDVQKSLASVNIAAGNTSKVLMTFSLNTAGVQRGQISINDHPITFDDNYYFTFTIDNNRKVLAINQRAPSPYLQSVYTADSSFTFDNANAAAVNYAALKNNNLVILNNLGSVSSGMVSELKQYVANGGTLAIFPDSAANLSEYNSLLSALNADAISAWNTAPDKVIRLDLQHIIFKNMFDNIPENVDLPLVNSHFDFIVRSNSVRNVVMAMNGSAALLAEYMSGNGKVYVFNVPLSESNSNFVAHALFAPIMYRMALMRNKQAELSYVIGRDESFSIDNNDVAGEDVFHLSNKTLNFDIIPQHASNVGSINIFFSDAVKQAGNYELTLKNIPVTCAAFNYNKQESQLSYYNVDDVKSLIEKYGLSNFTTIENTGAHITDDVSKQSDGVQLWKYCIVATLLFLLIEILLIRLWKA